MKPFVLAALIAAPLLTTTPALSATLSLALADMTVTSADEDGNMLEMQGVADGVTFTLTSISARGFNRFVYNYDDSAIKFGLPGNGQYNIAVTADADLSSFSFVGADTTLLYKDADGQPMNVTLDNAPVLSGVTFLDTGALDVGAVNAGQTVNLFVADTSVWSSAGVSAINFEIAEVPLPAALPMLLAGLGGVMAVRRRS